MTANDPAAYQSISNAGQRFLKIYERCIGLNELSIEIREKAEKNIFEIPSNAILSDLTRSSIVLAVAGFDDYFTSRFTENIVPYIRRRGVTKGLEDMLARSGFSYAEAIDMATMKRPMSRLKSIIQDGLENYVTQKIETIDALFLSIGVENLCQRVQEHAGRKTMIRRVEILIEKRHEIVHKGHLDKRGRIKNISARDTRGRIDDLYLFIWNTDVLLNKIHGIK